MRSLVLGCIPTKQSAYGIYCLTNPGAQSRSDRMSNIGYHVYGEIGRCSGYSL